MSNKINISRFSGDEIVIMSHWDKKEKKALLRSGPQR
jgi:hypothetical protein